MAKKKPAAPVVFQTKLGTAKGVERSRIWIEGKRLVDAGFTVGRYFVKTWLRPYPKSSTQYTPYLQLNLVVDDDILATAPCKVSGKGAKPIIDITGEQVREMFGAATHVQVEYTQGVILITVVG